MVVMERTEAFMSRNLESKSLCDPLNGEVAELLKFEFIHTISLLFTVYRLLFTVYGLPFTVYGLPFTH